MLVLLYIAGYLLPGLFITYFIYRLDLSGTDFHLAMALAVCPVLNLMAVILLLLLLISTAIIREGEKDE